MQSTPYTPGADQEWQTVTAEAAGFDAARLADAITFHRAHETAWPRSMYHPDGRYVGTVHAGDRDEYAEVIGPVRARGEPNGVILRGGKLVAEWGDTRRADMTFSVTKSYLSLLTGIAVADGLIPDIDRPVRADVNAEWFESPHNAPITWRHLLQQTSEWQGTLWGKPDAADHNRAVGGTTGGREDNGVKRTLKQPGAHFEYNDVRVNLLAACLTLRFGRALPEVLKERVMDPIGASVDWEWHAYRNAFVEIDGRPVASVPGGGHWGGGMMIGSRDHARMGILVANGGDWGGRQIVPRQWVQAMFTPSPALDQYGLMWWLNAGGSKRYPSATEASVFGQGAGASIVWIEPDLDLVAVVRWIASDAANDFLGRVLAALR
ncbi:serine hydrolase domain-containing protein [Paraburkholderia sp. RL17-337-BIB-A]|uniref:serine hydrolase domain-containing protein n=1 Tax=Paraburkholderia sp. RL17-337-BIB-A TaxID=3031636 RepID=UPI0038BDC946